MRSFSKLIPGEEIDAVSRWDFNDIESAAILMEQQEREREFQEHLEHACQQAREQGYADGYQQGRSHTLLEAQKQVSDFLEGQGKQVSEQFVSLVQKTERELLAAEQHSAEQVLALACEIARQVLRRELSVRADAVVPVVQEALGMLFTDTRPAQIRLHPEDQKVLQEHLASSGQAVEVTLMPDATLMRGGCIVESGGTFVDGRLEKRWERAVGRLGQDVSWGEGHHEAG